MKSALKWIALVGVGILAAFVLPELPEGMKTMMLFGGGGYLATLVIQNSVREALRQAKTEEMSALYNDHEEIRRMARQIDHLTQLIERITGRPRL